MRNIIELLRRNWLVIILVATIVVVLTRRAPGGAIIQPGFGGAELGGTDMMKTSSIGMMPPVFQETAPVESTDRLVVRNSSLSLKVGDVRKAIDEISAITVRFGGFLVDSSLSEPEEGASGNISVRIPSARLAEGLSSIRILGVKVVSENIVGTDVTAEFVDIEARLDTLNKTKAKFEQIMAGATNISDLLNVQQQIINLQSQIDSLVGQRKYLEQTAKLSLVTVYLATDELALPYAPAVSWRPSVIFKEAVRALILSMRDLGTVVIWVAVYSPVWLSVGLVFWWLKRRLGGE